MEQQGAGAYFLHRVSAAAHAPPAGLGGARAGHTVLRAERFRALPALALRKDAIVWAFSVWTLLLHLSSVHRRDDTDRSRERFTGRSSNAKGQRLFQRDGLGALPGCGDFT